LAIVASGCGGEPEAGVDAGVVEDIGLTALAPGLVLPGTRLVVSGSGFIPDFGGASRLRLAGTLEGARVEVAIALSFVDYDRMEGTWPDALSLGLPRADGAFQGQAIVEADSSLDGLTHRSAPLPTSLTLASELVPRLDMLQNEVLFVNDPVVAHGDGFLLGGSEGQTLAIVEGCFTLEGAGECVPVGPTEVPAAPFSEFDRSRVVFPFSPYIAGIRPGHFDGSVYLVNRHGIDAGHVEHQTGSLPTANDIIEPAVVALSPTGASLGQYVDVRGGGFVGGAPGDPVFALTTLELDGELDVEGTSTPTSIALVPEFVNGQLARYVINEEDDLGTSVDLRKIGGRFTGTVRPVIEFGEDRVEGSTTAVVLDLLRVKQLVWLRFLPTYVESLRHFGLRAAEPRIRERVLAVVERDYGGVNIEFRSELPTDYALFSQVEIAGPDPNGLGLLGYDNTPGKDNGNQRLYDRIGGVNALTQEDGYPGFGGIFVESLFVFSNHPNGLASGEEGSDEAFDALFDAFRPDLGSQPVSAAELASAPLIETGAACPAGDRPSQIGCAIWALGSMIGTTLSHEIAHSLGLADPGGPAFHNTGDWPNAIMDAGAARSFRERAEIFGEGPGSFCRIDYDYLRSILPSDAPDPIPSRQECY
jgi:hypothetical protein